MKKNLLVVYLFTKFDKLFYLKEFIKHYKRYKPGCHHKLIICLKLIQNNKIKKIRSVLNNIKYLEFIDPFDQNDFDFGSYGRVAKRFKNKIIFFMNSHSYPVKKNWLKTMLKFYKNKTILSSSASNESILTALKLKKIFKIFNYIKKYSKFKKKFFPFPNPHIRTANFLISSKDFLLFNRNRNYKSKEDAWFSESGKNGITNFFKNRGYKLLVVNSDSRSFDEKNWVKSDTYYSNKQNKLLISDRHTRKYEKLSMKEKKKMQKKVWLNL